MCKRTSEYLNNQVKYLGFGEGFQEALNQAMQSGPDKIDFPISKEFISPGLPEKSKAVDFVLHFNKGKESNMYFLNSYSAQLKTKDEELKPATNFLPEQG